MTCRSPRRHASAIVALTLGGLLAAVLGDGYYAVRARARRR